MNLDRDFDLLLAVSGTAFLIAVILFVPSFSLARIFLGLPFVLFLPGYALLAVLKPRKDDMDQVARMALSIGLSMAIVPLLGIAMNFTPVGVRMVPFVAIVAGFVLLVSLLGVYRRYTLLQEGLYGAPVGAILQIWSTPGKLKRFLLFAIGIAIIGLVVLLPSLTATDPGETFTEFYFPGSGSTTEGNPEALVIGEVQRLRIGVANYEGREVSYRIVVRQSEQELGSYGPIHLSQGDKFEGEVTFIPIQAGEQQRVELVLYKDGVEEPYRRLNLWVNGRTR